MQINNDPKLDEYLAEIETRVQDEMQDPEKGVRGIEQIIEELKSKGLVIEASRVQNQLNAWVAMGEAAYEASKELK